VGHQSPLDYRAFMSPSQNSAGSRRKSHKNYENCNVCNMGQGQNNENCNVYNTWQG